MSSVLACYKCLPKIFPSLDEQFLDHPPGALSSVLFCFPILCIQVEMATEHGGVKIEEALPISNPMENY